MWYLRHSHPYASMRVVSSDGRAIYLDLDKISEVSAPFDAEAADARAKMEQASSAEERTRLLLERYERASGLNALMATWVDDLRFVLDSITAPLGQNPKLQAISDRIDADQIGLLGMSFGGGASYGAVQERRSLPRRSEHGRRHVRAAAATTAAGTLLGV